MCRCGIELYTVADLQQIFKCSRSAVYKMLKSPGFPSFKANGRRYVRLEDLDRWIERRLNKCAV